MELLFSADLATSAAVLLGFCLFCALAFEFVNGFHDTANAVATVIYTNALKPHVAVVLSGICNFTGVFLGGIAVAIGIIKLLPLELLVSGGTGASIAMVLALLMAAIIWNVGTWYFGLPSSSSHTLIGAILGVGIANSLLPGHTFGEGVNWSKAGDIGISLLVSPLFGFSVAYGLLKLVRRLARDEALFSPPTSDQPPPLGIRSLLVGTSMGVSFAHGSNDGQKGVGLIMLILMGIVPANFALDAAAPPATLRATVEATRSLEAVLHANADASSKADVDKAVAKLHDVAARLDGHDAASEIPADQRFAVRQAILNADSVLDKLVKSDKLKLDAKEKAKLKKDREAFRAMTDYAPTWVLVAVALALGIGTMIGWRRIVITVGEKIGKSHLTYAQGASAEIIAASTIGLSSWLGLPVSTTHVLSSGVAGTMVAHKSGLQVSTVRNIGLAWLLTLPISVLLSGGLYLLLRLALV